MLAIEAASQAGIGAAPRGWRKLVKPVVAGFQKMLEELAASPAYRSNATGRGIFNFPF